MPFLDNKVVSYLNLSYVQFQQVKKIARKQSLETNNNNSSSNNNNSNGNSNNNNNSDSNSSKKSSKSMKRKKDEDSDSSDSPLDHNSSDEQLSGDTTSCELETFYFDNLPYYLILVIIYCYFYYKVQLMRVSRGDIGDPRHLRYKIL